MDWRNGKSLTIPSRSLMPKRAEQIMLMRGSTNEVIAVLLGENMPSPPCAIGRVASVWVYFGSASLLDAVWRTKHVSRSI
eukprot:4400363-Ditylum_brightwellii.AAC.1